MQAFADMLMSLYLNYGSRVEVAHHLLNQQYCHPCLQKHHWTLNLQGIQQL